MYWVLLATGTAFGLLAGSFLNVVIHRGPRLWKLTDDATRRGNLATPRSYCPSCETQLRAHHLIPVVSYLALGGKCSTCNASIPARYPFVEAAAALAGVLAVALFSGAPMQMIAAALFFWLLLGLAVIDLETGYLPDALTLPLLVIGLGANSVGLFVPVLNAVIGALCGYGSFRLIGFAFKKLRGIEGLGQGDAKLLAAVGAWLGWQSLSPVVFIAAFVALIGVGAAALIRRNIDRTTPIPFGPALAAASALIFIFYASGEAGSALAPIFP